MKKSKVKRNLTNFFRGAFICFVCSIVFTNNSQAQTSGAFNIEKSVVASSGGTIAGGAFTVESTVGQPSTGLSQNTPFSLFGGFITPTFAPTATGSSISGRVLKADGAGIRNALVSLIYPNGTSRTISTGAFGMYQFEDIPAGEIYFVTVASKRFSFDNPTRIVWVNEEITELNFIAAQ